MTRVAWTGWRMGAPRAWLAAVLLLAAGSAGAQATSAPDNTGPNASITRWAEGEYAYRSLADGRDRGWERFRLTVHPDGSRTLLMWHDLRARSAQFNVMLHVDGAFRPLDAFVSYWNDGRYKGSSAMMVAGPTLELVSRGAWGTLRETVQVPERFSIGTHPIAGDGWHIILEGPGAPRAMVYGLEAGADPAKPIRGELREMPVERVGTERISVPAGEFDTVHYRFAGMTDVWISGDDRLMVRMRNARADRDYVLQRYSSGR
jgi:hypothetical protein